jgi:hypothetical protein
MKKSQLKKKKKKPQAKPEKKDRMITIRLDDLNVIYDSAEARCDQWEAHAKSRDPFETDCIYECDVEEATNIGIDLRAALNRVSAATTAFYKAKK